MCLKKYRRKKIHFRRGSLRSYAIFITSLTHVVLAGDLMPAGIVLVTPALGSPHEKKFN